MQKGFLLIVIILLLVTVGAITGGRYFFPGPDKVLEQGTDEDQGDLSIKKAFPPSSSQNPSDEIANWKTYTGLTFNFKYPPDWTYSGGEPNINLINQDNQRIIILVSTPKGLTSLADWVALVDKAGPGLVINSKSLSIDSMDAVDRHEKRRSQSGREYEVEAIYAMSGSQVYDIELQPRTEKSLPLFYQIISTFKFTN